MFSTPLVIRIFSAFCTFCLLACLPVNAWPKDTFDILILNSYDESAMPYARLKEVFMGDLQQQYASHVVFYQFDLQERGEAEQSRDELKIQLLLDQFALIPPDLVISFGPPGVAFWLNNRRSFFLGLPFIAVGSDFNMEKFTFADSDSVVASPFSFEEMVEDVLRLRPETKHFLMVFGASQYERALAGMTQRQLSGYSDRISFEYTNDWTVGALQARLADLKPESVVFYGILDSDSNGVVLNNYYGITLVRAATAAPVFGAFDDLLGRGIVGGTLMPLERVGQECAAVANEAFQGKPLAQAWRQIESNAPTYDWRELQTWGIDTTRLPAGSIIRFKPPAVWEQYGGWFILAAVIFLSQSLLAASLWVQRKRLRRAKQVSNNLGRKLISAQEDERRLIARELHDDLSQRLAGLAIDVSYVVSNQGSEKANQVLGGLRPGLVSLSKDVHDLSYRLHPSLLDDLGLVAALQAELQRLRRQSGAVILETFHEIAEAIPPELALCAYRIAQEAVYNAVKYARASAIRVELSGVAHQLVLTVSDDGIGYDTASESGGLGLSSMQERAELVGGVLSTHSKLGKGTTVRLVASLKGAKG